MKASSSYSDKFCACIVFRIFLLSSPRERISESSDLSGDTPARGEAGAVRCVRLEVLDREVTQPGTFLLLTRPQFVPEQPGKVSNVLPRGRLKNGVLSVLWTEQDKTRQDKTHIGAVLLHGVAHLVALVSPAFASEEAFLAHVEIETLETPVSGHILS